jgi:hypothetical protein
VADIKTWRRKLIWFSGDSKRPAFYGSCSNPRWVWVGGWACPLSRAELAPAWASQEPLRPAVAGILPAAATLQHCNALITCFCLGPSFMQVQPRGGPPALPGAG